jgi:hypothetical protein
MHKVLSITLLFLLFSSALLTHPAPALNTANPVEGIALWAALSGLIFSMVGNSASTNLAAGVSLRREIEEGNIIGWIKAEKTCQIDAQAGDVIRVEEGNVYLYRDQQLSDAWLYLRKYSHYRVMETAIVQGIRVYKISALIE